MQVKNDTINLPVGTNERPANLETIKELIKIGCEVFFISIYYLIFVVGGLTAVFFIILELTRFITKIL